MIDEVNELKDSILLDEKNINKEKNTIVHNKSKARQKHKKLNS